MPATTTRTALTPSIRVGTAPLDDNHALSLLRLTVAVSVHTAGSATLVFEDPWFRLFDQEKFVLGTKIVIKIPDVSGQFTTVFTGKITSVGIEDDHAPGKVSIPRMVVEARDGSQALAASATFEAYLSGASDVVDKIARRHGLSAAVVGSPAVSGYILQAGTDHAMLTELARRCGYEWFTDGTKLHFRPRPAPSGPALSRSDGTLLRFSARYTGVDTPSAVEVHGWDPAAAAAHKGDGASALSGGASDLGSDAPFVRDQYGKAKTAFGKPLNVGDPGSRDAAEATAVATGLARELVGAGLHAQGLAPSNPAIAAGSYVKIEDMGTKLSGSYYVTAVTHEFGPDRELRTSFTCGGHRPEPTPWSPTFGGETWAGRGPVTGVVSNLNDPEAYGRVKVKFPSLGNIESDWARVVSPGAGDQRGLDFRPEMNDEVLVGFERGDPRFPLVLGGLWNGKNAIPRTDLVADGKVVSRVIASRKGHSIELADGDDPDSRITVKLQNGTLLTLSEQDGVVIDVAKGDLELKTKKGSLKLTEDGDLTIDVMGAVTVKAAEAVKVDGKDKIVLKAAMGAKIDGGTAFEAKGAQGKVEGSGMLTLKGGMVKIN